MARHRVGAELPVHLLDDLQPGVVLRALDEPRAAGLEDGVVHRCGDFGRPTPGGPVRISNGSVMVTPERRYGARRTRGTEFH